MSYTNHAMFNMAREAFQISRGRGIACGANPAASYRVLNRMLINNNWRRTVRDALYFEKPTDKRKRLHRERSERVFREQVSDRVTLAKKMLDMGY
ncbi:hypothetical protein AMAG_09741 [Allomyces macrogynus ATCC 38327]|uniref:Ribosomal protein S21 n=1 Tax=Allomyces macrogynus (strain ATCC 38327) TaxID=578462 RepID=A0A0L0STD0_ALLM3|nr:hypothetical protein GGF31_007749 [Allomyces arbusculus]KNE62550.1 hypothetical protein AMAG_07758 [Allomyces macrogynus ATCC 38327]KNE65761.1 hypothetical protein AMAG_09741 [Allomyces macrogynus ATCC 38327]|eukprot:KNE62550.1 hypothetical protein AMAG_07758 [Allomyces macrogynus ATCC 38327]